MKFALGFILIALTTPLHAEVKDWKFTTGLIYQSSKIYRGAWIWPAPSIMPMLGISYKRLSIHGPGLVLNIPYQKFSFQFGTSYFNDGPPLFPLKKRRKDFRNQRHGVYEAILGGTWEFWPRFKLGLNASKALTNHHGIYGIANLQIPLIPFVSSGYAIGWGNRKANQYAYGPEAISGTAHRDFNISLALPFLPWGGILVTKYTTSRIHKTVNKKASYVLPSDKPATLSSMANWTF